MVEGVLATWLAPNPSPLNRSGLLQCNARYAISFSREREGLSRLVLQLASTISGVTVLSGHSLSAIEPSIALLREDVGSDVTDPCSGCIMRYLPSGGFRH